MKPVIATLASLWMIAGASAVEITPEIAIALTDERVEVDTGFAGARLTLFGAVTGVENPAETIDIITVIRGPPGRFLIRQLEKKNLIWAPGRARTIDGAPGLYLTYATQAIGDIAPLPDQASYQLGADFLEFAADGPDATLAASVDNTLYKNAFLTEVEDQGLYRDAIGGVSFKKDALFTINVVLPGTTPVGDYAVSVYLYRDGVMLGEDTATLAVNKVGVERRIYEVAHLRPVSYGVLSVALSLFAGWVAALAFRK